MKNFSDVCRFMTDILGAQHFEDEVEDFVCFVKMSALTNPNVTDTWMKSKLRKYATTIIMASIKDYLDRNYADTNGDISLNVGFGMVYDKEMKPIEVINKIKQVQRGMMKLMVNQGMDEFLKGRELAYSMIERADLKDDPQMSEPTKEHIQKAIKALEKKLPKITKEEASELLDLYAYIKTMGVD